MASSQPFSKGEGTRRLERKIFSMELIFCLHLFTDSRLNDIIQIGFIGCKAVSFLQKNEGDTTLFILLIIQ